MDSNLFKLRNFCWVILCLLLSLPAVAQKTQKNKKSDKLEKRRFDIEIKETTTEGKKYEKAEFEFFAKEIESEYFDSKLKVKTIHYQTEKDSSYTEEGDELKYFKVKGKETSQKADEVYVVEIVIKGREITGTISLVKGDKPKRTWEFEGTQQN